MLAQSADLWFNCSLLKQNIKSNEIEYERERPYWSQWEQMKLTQTISAPFSLLSRVIKGSILSHLASAKCSSRKGKKNVLNGKKLYFPQQILIYSLTYNNIHRLCI